MRQQHNKVKSMTIAAMLCAIGIVIPMFAPRFAAGPISFTLASHVPIFIAMFISPTIAISVALITSFGFIFAGVNIEIVIRAFTHLIFALVGSYLLKKNGRILLSLKSSSLYCLAIAVIHAVAEVVAVTIYYQAAGIKQESFAMVILVGVGLGTFIHSTVDFIISVFVWNPLQHMITIPANAKVKVR